MACGTVSVAAYHMSVVYNGMQYGELDGGGGHEEKEMDLEESSSKYSNDNTDDC